MIFLGGTSGFHYGQVVLQIHLSVGQVDFLTKFDPWYNITKLAIALSGNRHSQPQHLPNPVNLLSILDRNLASGGSCAQWFEHSTSIIASL